MEYSLLLIATLISIVKATLRYEPLIPVVRQVDRREQSSITKSASSFGCSIANIDVIRSCYALFLEKYNLQLDAARKLPPFMYFLQATTLTPFQDLCTPTNSLMNCLSTRVPSECLNIATYRILTYNEEEAFDYLSSFAAFEYVCGNGMEEFVNNEECFVRSTNDPYLRQQLGNCALLIDAARPVDVCQSGVVDAQCVRDAYMSYCGPQLAHGMCMVRVNFIRRLDIVDINCLSELTNKCNFAAPALLMSHFLLILFSISFLLSI